MSSRTIASIRHHPIPDAAFQLGARRCAICHGRDRQGQAQELAHADRGRDDRDPGNRRLCALRRRFTERPLRRRLRGYSRGDRGQIRHGRFRIFHYAFDAQIDVRQRNEVRRLANQCFWACVHQNLVCIPGIFDIVAIRRPVRGVPDPTSIRPKAESLSISENELIISWLTSRKKSIQIKVVGFAK